MINSGGAPTSKVTVYRYITFPEPAKSKFECLFTYPNPATDELFINNPYDFEIIEAVQIFNGLGELIFDEIIEHHLIDVSGLQTGTYSIRIFFPIKKKKFTNHPLFIYVFIDK